MKTKLIFFGLLCFNLSFGQFNFSPIAVQSPIPVVSSAAPNEIFRFQPGNVTQLDAGTNFNLNILNGPVSSRWFSLGGVGTGPGRRAYGLRFQAGEKAVTFGYQNVNDALNINPRIEWIGTGASLGNLEFRVADSFTSTASKLVATMASDGSTVFGDGSSAVEGAVVSVTNSNSGSNSIGINSFADSGITTIGVFGSATPGVNTNFSGFAAGIYGSVQQFVFNGNQFAGYFDGRVFGTSFLRPSDGRIKQDIEPLTNNLNRIAQTLPVTYKYIKTDKLNLDAGLQHGFITQDLEKIFPELITEVNKPVFGKDGKVIEIFKFKTIDYMGMISILAGGIKELHAKVEALEKIIASKGEPTVARLASESAVENSTGAFMQQNIPNPFADQTTISYQLPEESTTAEIIVFDLNGRLIKTYSVNKNQSQLTIRASEIGSGLFIYSLVQNGQELLSKKMIIK